MGDRLTEALARCGENSRVLPEIVEPQHQRVLALVESDGATEVLAASLSDSGFYGSCFTCGTCPCKHGREMAANFQKALVAFLKENPDD